VEKRAITGDNRPRPVGSPWTTRCTACGSPLCPQSVEIVCPPIHSRLSWSDGRSPGCAVDRIGTTSRSPACGREKVTESVDGSRNPGPESNTGARGRGADGGRVAVGGRGRALVTGPRGWVGAEMRGRGRRDGACGGCGRGGGPVGAATAPGGPGRRPLPETPRPGCGGCLKAGPVVEGAAEARDGCGGRRRSPVRLEAGAGEARRRGSRHGVWPCRGGARARARSTTRVMTSGAQSVPGRPTGTCTRGLRIDPETPRRNAGPSALSRP
jgi:hypothetical protein